MVGAFEALARQRHLDQSDGSAQLTQAGSGGGALADFRGNALENLRPLGILRRRCAKVRKKPR